MPYASSRVRLGVEAGRAFIGIWFVAVSLAGAQPLYRWLEARYPAHPEFSLLTALGLAILACVGIGLTAVAGFRALMHAIRPRPAVENTVA